MVLVEEEEHHEVLKWGKGPRGSEGEYRGPRGFGVLLLATRLRQQERLCQEERGERTLAGGP